MINKRFSLILLMLVLAIFAVGSVSATDDIATDIDVSTDDVVIDEVAVDDTSVDDVVENDNELEETGNSPIVNVSNADDIQGKINNASSYSVINFTSPTYENFHVTLKDNLTLVGNGARLVGDGSHDLFTVTGFKNIVITGFIMDINSTSHAAVYGSGVKNIVVKNNTIENCRDGISFFKSYDNVKIEDNKFNNVSRDAISLANPQGTGNWDNLVGAIINNNTITNAVYGIFIGGAFKGTISNNNLINGTYGIEFAGKPTSTQGKLNATIVNTTITGYTTGINMLHPNIIYLLLDHVNITVPDEDFDIAINTEYPFGTYSYIGVYNSNFIGDVSDDFVNATGSNQGNNTGFN